MLESGADPNQADVDGWTAIHYATYLGDSSIVDYLLSQNKGCLEAKTNNGCTPLWFASRKYHTDCIRLLIEKGASPKIVNSKGLPLLVAVCTDHKKDLVSGLVSHGADLEAIDSQGQSALHAAARGGNIEVLTYLLEISPNPNIQDNKGCTPLASAAGVGHVECVRQLLKSKADPEICGTDGRRPLHLASLGNHDNCASVLLEQKANVNASDSEGCRPLHIASASDSVGVVNILLSHNADKDALDRESRTPLWYASNSGHLKCVDRLLESKADRKIYCRRGHQPAHRATIRGRPDILKHLVQDGSEFVNEDGKQSILELAEASNDPEVLQIIKEKVKVTCATHAVENEHPHSLDSSQDTQTDTAKFKGVSMFNVIFVHRYETILTIFLCFSGALRTVLIFIVIFVDSESTNNAHDKERAHTTGKNKKHK